MHLLLVASLLLAAMHLITISFLLLVAMLFQLHLQELVEPHEVSVVRRSPRQRDADEADQARSEVEPSVAPSLGLGLLDEPMWVQRVPKR